MFLVFAILLGVLPIAFWGKINKRHNLEGACICAIAISCIIIFVHMITYAASLENIAGMEAFYNNNKTVYSQAVEKFPEAGRIVTNDDSTTVYVLAYDMTKNIVNYNETLIWYRNYQSHWFLGGFVGKIPDSLEYISIN